MWTEIYRSLKPSLRSVSGKRCLAHQEVYIITPTLQSESVGCQGDETDSKREKCNLSKTESYYETRLSYNSTRLHRISHITVSPTIRETFIVSLGFSWKCHFESALRCSAWATSWDGWSLVFKWIPKSSSATTKKLIHLTLLKHCLMGFYLWSKIFCSVVFWGFSQWWMENPVKWRSFNGRVQQRAGQLVCVLCKETKLSTAELWLCSKATVPSSEQTQYWSAKYNISLHELAS